MSWFTPILRGFRIFFGKYRIRDRGMRFQFRSHFFRERIEFRLAEQRELIGVDVLATRSILLSQELRDAMPKLLNRLLILGVRLHELGIRRLQLHDDRMTCRQI